MPKRSHPPTCPGGASFSQVEAAFNSALAVSPATPVLVAVPEMEVYLRSLTINVTWQRCVPSVG